MSWRDGGAERLIPVLFRSKPIKMSVPCSTPLGRMGEPVEIVAGVVYVASPSAGFVTGVVLDINGGFAM